MNHKIIYCKIIEACFSDCFPPHTLCFICLLRDFVLIVYLRRNHEIIGRKIKVYILESHRSAKFKSGSASGSVRLGLEMQAEISVIQS